MWKWTVEEYVDELENHVFFEVMKILAFKVGS